MRVKAGILMLMLATVLAFCGCPPSSSSQTWLPIDMHPTTAVRPYQATVQMTWVEELLDEVVQAVEALGYTFHCTIAPSNTSIANASVYAGSDYCRLGYNDLAFAEFALSGRDEIITTVLGHEVGHIILSMECGTTECGDPKISELYADEIGGCVLAILGKTEDQAISASKFFGTLSESESHPPGRDRAIAVLSGYGRCLEAINGGMSNGNSYER